MISPIKNNLIIELHVPDLGTEITITTNNIEEIYQIATKNLKKHIVRDLKALEDHEHKWRDFRIVDPFGFYLRFTELLDWGQK